MKWLKILFCKNEEEKIYSKFNEIQLFKIINELIQHIGVANRFYAEYAKKYGYLWHREFMLATYEIGRYGEYIKFECYPVKIQTHALTDDQVLELIAACKNVMAEIDLMKLRIDRVKKNRKMAYLMLPSK